jgi:hypothetical protein
VHAARGRASCCSATSRRAWPSARSPLGGARAAAAALGGAAAAAGDAGGAGRRLRLPLRDGLPRGAAGDGHAHADDQARVVAAVLGLLLLAVLGTALQRRAALP